MDDQDGLQFADRGAEQRTDGDGGLLVLLEGGVSSRIFSLITLFTPRAFSV
ncbi:MAG TPA: hypothetical protein VNP03_07385 [Pseudonocardia sp.]|nr:hypothetical protein [Pseudonocardia sp.]